MQVNMQAEEEKERGAALMTLSLSAMVTGFGRCKEERLTVRCKDEREIERLHGAKKGESSKVWIEGMLQSLGVGVDLSRDARTTDFFKSTTTHVVTPRKTVSWRTRAAWVSGVWIMPLAWVCER